MAQPEKPNYKQGGWTLDWETIILEKIKMNDFTTADDLLAKHQNDLQHLPVFYYLNGYLHIKKENLTNAWLWLWRGLEFYSDDPVLTYLMQNVYKRFNRPDQAAVYMNKSEPHNHGTDPMVSRFPLEISPIHFPSDTADHQQSPRILQGSIEIANQMHTSSTGLGQYGVISHTLNYYPYYLKYRSDYEWSLIGQRNTPEINALLRKLSYQLQSFYDIFHFHWGTSLTLDGTDIPILKEGGKKLVMQHWGTDVRLYSEAVKRNPYVRVKNRNEDQIKRNLQRLSEQISHCIVSDFELYDWVKDYYDQVSVIPAMVDLSRYIPLKQKHENGKPLIVHAPTSPAIKGTAYILKAVEALQERYDFDFVAVQGKSHEEAMDIFKKADLIIDQLHIGSYGLFAVETMAMAKPVICWISDDMKERYPNDLPIIVANPDTIKDRIEHALKNLDMLPEKGLQGRRYVEQHHDMIKNSRLLLALYESL